MTKQRSLSSAPGARNVPPPLWDDSDLPPTRPQAPAPPPLSPEAVRRLKRRKRYPNSLPTDVLEWLSANTPQNFDELMDLRKTLYSRKHCFGKYFITSRGTTSLGEEKFVLNGPGGAVLVLSNRCRHFLLRTLNRLRRANRWPPIVYR